MASKPTAKQVAWRAEFARRFGGKKSKGSAKKGGSTRMASKKAGGSRSQKQGLVSWGTSVIACVLGLANPVVRVIEAVRQPSGSKIPYLTSAFAQDYVGLELGGWDGSSWTSAKFKPWLAIRGTGTLAMGIGFKKGTSYLAKVAPIKSLIPRLGM